MTRTISWILTTAYIATLLASFFFVLKFVWLQATWILCQGDLAWSPCGVMKASYTEPIASVVLVLLIEFTSGFVLFGLIRILIWEVIRKIVDDLYCAIEERVNRYIGGTP